MKYFFSFTCMLFLNIIILLPEGICSQNKNNVDPCSLIATEKLSAVFPTLLKAEKQSVGPETVCNYLDKMDIPALIISVTKAGSSVHRSLSMLGSGYVIEDISGLGDEAAIAIQQANPKFGLKEGIAAMHIKKGDRSLTFSFFRINLMPDEPAFDKIKVLAAEMIGKL